VNTSFGMIQLSSGVNTIEIRTNTFWVAESEGYYPILMEFGRR
jgi:hypothetical protein